MKKYPLRIALDSSFHSFFVKDLSVFGDSTYLYQHQKWDSLHKIELFYWDSLPAGNYTFTITNLWNRKKEYSLQIPKDSFFCPKNEQNSWRRLAEFDKNSIASADTIDLVLIANGCFHFKQNHVQLIKNKAKNNYTVKEISNESGNLRFGFVDNSFVDSLYQIQKEAADMYKKEQAKPNIYGNHSTSSRHFLLVINGHYIEYSDRDFADWNFDNRLKEILYNESIF